MFGLVNRWGSSETCGPTPKATSWGSNNAWERLSVQEANQIPPEQLRRKSFFKPFERGDLYDPVAGSKTAAEPMVRAKVLAEAIPALSWATGANPVDRVFGGNNVDMMMNLKNGWPESRMGGNRGRTTGFFRTARTYESGKGCLRILEPLFAGILGLQAS